MTTHEQPNKKSDTSIWLRKVSTVTASKWTFVPKSDHIVINCLSWSVKNVMNINGVTIPLYQVSPYYLKTKEGYIFENFYQAHKVYSSVTVQNQTKEGWNHPAEVHVDSNGILLKVYWEWRHKLMMHTAAVRYPNGYNGKGKVVCSVTLDSNTGQCTFMDYIKARYEVYIKSYCQLIKETDAFKCLKALVDSGVKLEFAEIDCPDTIEVTMDNFNTYLNMPKPSFGHTWVLAGCLLGWL
jgi:hypothetical protein